LFGRFPTAFPEFERVYPSAGPTPVLSGAEHRISSVIPSILQTVRIELNLTSPETVLIFYIVPTATPQKAAAAWIFMPTWVRADLTNSPNVLVMKKLGLLGCQLFFKTGEE
jgi:hypothetical protein